MVPKLKIRQKVYIFRDEDRRLSVGEDEVESIKITSKGITYCLKEARGNWREDFLFTSLTDLKIFVDNHIDEWALEMKKGLGKLINQLENKEAKSFGKVKV